MRPFVEIKDLTIRFPEGNSSFEAVKHVSSVWLGNPVPENP